MDETELTSATTAFAQALTPVSRVRVLEAMRSTTPHAFEAVVLNALRGALDTAVAADVVEQLRKDLPDMPIDAVRALATTQVDAANELRRRDRKASMQTMRVKLTTAFRAILTDGARAMDDMAWQQDPQFTDDDKRHPLWRAMSRQFADLSYEFAPTPRGPQRSGGPEMSMIIFQDNRPVDQEVRAPMEELWRLWGDKFMVDALDQLDRRCIALGQRSVPWASVMTRHPHMECNALKRTAGPDVDPGGIWSEATLGSLVRDNPFYCRDDSESRARHFVYMRSAAHGRVLVDHHQDFQDQEVACTVVHASRQLTKIEARAVILELNASMVSISGRRDHALKVLAPGQLPVSWHNLLHAPVQQKLEKLVEHVQERCSTTSRTYKFVMSVNEQHQRGRNVSPLQIATLDKIIREISSHNG